MTEAVKTPKVVEEKLDIHGRDAATRERDKWYTESARKISELGMISPLAADRFGYAQQQHYVEIVRKNADGTAESIQVPLATGIYDRTTLRKEFLAIGKQEKLPPKEEIAKRVFAKAGFARAVALHTEGEGTTGSSAPLRLAPIPDGFVIGPTALVPLSGTVVTFDGSGNIGYDSMKSEAEYHEYLRAVQGQHSMNNMWTMDIPCAAVAGMANHAEEMLGKLRDQIKTLPGVSIYSIHPRWLRYFSDGDMSSQKTSGIDGTLRLAPGVGSGLRPLLYDGPAWVVGIFLGKKMIPGRVFVNSEGQFLCSDWCQREVDKRGGIDLITGKNTKHTLATWIAGPGLSRFAQGERVIKASHGTVRKAKVDLNRLRGIATAKLTASDIQKMDLWKRPNFNEVVLAANAMARLVAKGDAEKSAQVVLTIEQLDAAQANPSKAVVGFTPGLAALRYVRAGTLGTHGFVVINKGDLFRRFIFLPMKENGKTAVVDLRHASVSHHASFKKSLGWYDLENATYFAVPDDLAKGIFKSVVKALGMVPKP